MSGINRRRISLSSRICAFSLVALATPSLVTAQTAKPASQLPTAAPIKPKPAVNRAPQDLLPPIAKPAVKPVLAPIANNGQINGPDLGADHVPDLGPIPVAQPLLPVPIAEPVATWSITDANALLAYISTVESEGLIPADYLPDDLSYAIANGPGANLDKVASHAFVMLAEDLRDGRTPLDARVQWFAVDPDPELMPTAVLLGKMMETHDIATVLGGLAPDHGEYDALKAAYAATPLTATATRNLIQLNLDRWRWLPRDFGEIYIITNVPEFQLRLVSKHRVIRTYRTIVGKPGRTATPQLAEQVQAVVFNPTWTVPQSIVVGEGLGAKLIGDPASALRQGYAVKRLGDGSISVVQQPGPKNSLGLMKIDMPNPHAIYLHDTPSRGLFNSPTRAFSHGCIRTDKAVELGMIMAMLGTDITPEEAAKKSLAGKYARVVLTKSFPVYLTYFTFGRNVEGNLTKFRDIYTRDASALASFTAPRIAHSQQRSKKEEIIKLDNPL